MAFLHFKRKNQQYACGIFVCFYKHSYHNKAQRVFFFHLSNLGLVFLPEKLKISALFYCCSSKPKFKEQGHISLQFRQLSDCQRNINSCNYMVFSYCNTGGLTLVFIIFVSSKVKLTGNLIQETMLSEVCKTHFQYNRYPSRSIFNATICLYLVSGQTSVPFMIQNYTSCEKYQNNWIHVITDSSPGLTPTLIKTQK